MAFNTTFMRIYITLLLLLNIPFLTISAQDTSNRVGLIQYVVYPGQTKMNLYFSMNDCLTTYYSPTSARELPAFRNKTYASKEDSLKDEEMIAKISETLKEHPMNSMVIYKNIGNPYFIKTRYDNHFDKYCMNDSVVSSVKWEFLPDTSTILGLKCQKAKGVFKSGAYYFWYTEDIPVPFGPEKLGGLPGLIVQVEGITADYRLLPVKIEIPYKGNTAIAPCQDGKKITVTAFAELLNQQNGEQQQILKMVDKSNSTNGNN